MTETVLEQEGWKVRIVPFRKDKHWVITCPCYSESYDPVLKVMPVCFYHQGKMPENLKIAYQMLWS